MKEWKETTNRFIAFIDILGFENYVYRNSHLHVKKRMILLRELLSKTEQMISSVSRSMYNFGDSIRTVIFSDSILIISNDRSRNSLEILIFTCSIFLGQCLKNRIPIKGAISYGTITANFNSSLFFGKGLIDAYKLQEQLSIYGIVLDEKAEKKFKSFITIDKNDCVRCKVHTKSGKIIHYLIAWWATVQYFLTDNIDIEPLKLVESFYDDMSGYPRKYLDNTIELLHETKI